MYNYKNYSMQEGRDWCYLSSALCDNDVRHPNPESWLFHALLIGIKIGLFSKYRVGNEQTDICTDTLKTLCLRLPASPASLAHRRTYVHTRWKHYAYACQLHLRAWHTDGRTYVQTHWKHYAYACQLHRAQTSTRTTEHMLLTSRDVSLYRMRCNAEFYYVGKIPHVAIGRPSLQQYVVLIWLYSPRAAGTTLSDVHVLHRVPF